jgi:hypothetical protein
LINANPARRRVFRVWQLERGTIGGRAFRTSYIHAIKRFAMTPETEGKEEKGPNGQPFINDPGNEDPGSLMDDATVPLNDADEADMEYEEDGDEQ